MKNLLYVFMGICFAVASSISMYALINGHQARNKMEIVNNSNKPMQLVVELPFTRDIDVKIDPKQSKRISVKHEIKGLRLHRVGGQRLVGTELDKRDFELSAAERFANFTVTITPGGKLQLSDLKTQPKGRAKNPVRKSHVRRQSLKMSQKTS